jgi:hypothetical protein
VELASTTRQVRAAVHPLNGRLTARAKEIALFACLCTLLSRDTLLTWAKLALSNVCRLWLGAKSARHCGAVNTAHLVKVRQTTRLRCLDTPLTLGAVLKEAGLGRALALCIGTREGKKHRVALGSCRPDAVVACHDVELLLLGKCKKSLHRASGKLRDLLLLVDLRHK